MWIPSRYAVSLNLTDPLMRGLKLWWPFNEHTGTRAQDARRYNAGTLTGGPTWDASAVGGGITFNGTDQYVVSDKFIGISGTQKRSVSVWLKTTTSASAAIVGWGAITSTNAFVCFTDPTLAGGKTIYIATSGGNQQWLFTYDDGAWHQLVFVLPGPNISSAIAYADGRLLPVAGGTAQVISTTNGVVRVGTHINLANDLTGTVADVRIWNRAISAREVLRLRESPWPFPQGRFSSSSVVPQIQARRRMLGHI